MTYGLILHPTDGSEHARKALRIAIDLAKTRAGKILVLHVQRSHGSERIPQDMKQYERLEQVRVSEAELLKEAAEAIAAAAAAEARSLGWNEVECLTLEGDPVREIVDIAKRREAEMIVMGSRGLGDASGLLLGSVSHKVAHLAPCTCVIVR